MNELALALVLDLALHTPHRYVGEVQALAALAEQLGQSPTFALDSWDFTTCPRCEAEILIGEVRANNARCPRCNRELHRDITALMREADWLIAL